MPRQVNFARNPLATAQVAESLKITDKVRSVFDRGGSSNVHPQSTLKLEWLKPTPNQPRKTFDPAALEELKASIREHGILEPLVVRLRDSHYEIVCGERRYRAACELKLEEVPVTVHELDDTQAYAVSLHENIHRDNLTPMDEAQAYDHLMKSGLAANQQEVAKFVGVTQGRISQKLALLDLPTEIQSKIASGPKGNAAKGKLTERHARAIRKVGSSTKQKLLAARVIDQALSASATESLVQSMKKSPAKKAARSDTWITSGVTRYCASSSGLSVEIKSSDPARQVLALESLIKAIRRGKV